MIANVARIQAKRTELVLDAANCCSTLRKTMLKEARDHARHNRNVLPVTDGIGHDAAWNRTTGSKSIKHTACSRIQRQEVSCRFSGKDSPAEVVVAPATIGRSDEYCQRIFPVEISIATTPARLFPLAMD